MVRNDIVHQKKYWWRRIWWYWDDATKYRWKVARIRRIDSDWDILIDGTSCYFWGSIIQHIDEWELEKIKDKIITPNKNIKLTKKEIELFKELLK